MNRKRNVIDPRRFEGNRRARKWALEGGGPCVGKGETTGGVIGCVTQGSAICHLPLPVTPCAMPSSTQAIPGSVLVVGGHTTSPTTMNHAYKGKPARFWHDLPEEVVRYALLWSPMSTPPPHSTSPPG